MNTRFSLLSLLLVISLVASCLGWFVARRQVQQHAESLDALQAKHSSLRDSTGQIETPDPKKIYIRNLKTAAPRVFRFRVAIPTDMRASLDCRYDVGGQPVKLKTPPISTAVSNSQVSQGSHVVSELTIYVNRNSDSWSIGNYSSATNLSGFLPIRDENIMWLDNMREGVPLNGNAPGTGDSAGGIAAFMKVVASGSTLGIQYDTRSFSNSEEILVQEVWGMNDNKKHSIKFVISPHTVGDGSRRSK
jgi:hypothetical protein